MFESVAGSTVRPADCAYAKDLQMQAFQERLKGFEPSTFCMASSCSAPESAPKCLQIRRISGPYTRSDFQELRQITGGSDKERTMSHADQPCCAARALWASAGPVRASAARHSCYSGRKSGTAAPVGEGARPSAPAHRRRGLLFCLSREAAATSQLRTRSLTLAIRPQQAPRHGPGDSSVSRIATLRSESPRLLSAGESGSVDASAAFWEHRLSRGEAPYPGARRASCRKEAACSERLGLERPSSGTVLGT